MSHVPEQLRYTKTHEWIREDKQWMTVGITDHAQTMLGDLVYAELPEVEGGFTTGQECAVLESVKAAADIYCPVTGAIVEVNTAVIDNPQLINRDPYGQGWLFRIKPTHTANDQLLTSDQYVQLVAREAH